MLLLKVSIYGRAIINVRRQYADDVALLAETESDLHALLEEVGKESESYDLHMNIKKTKIMVCSNQPKQSDVHLNADAVEQVDSFIYLGASYVLRLT